MPIPLDDVVRYLDSFLRVAEIPDDARAFNGLQVDNPGSVSRIVAAVDACEATIREATAVDADLMLVHHGLFWGGLKPVTGPYGERLRLLLTHGIALYSAHLPLDCHVEVGNNMLLARKLGLADLVPFGIFEGIPIGFWGRTSRTLEDLRVGLQDLLGGDPRVISTGPDTVTQVGVVSGAGSGALREAAALGLDTLVTGEAPHHAYLDAEELGVNLVLCGHYATETLGVRELAARLGTRFSLPWTFVDHPTGL